MDTGFTQGGDYFGYIPETGDALRLIQLAVRGIINIHRERLTGRRRELVRSGSVFVVEEGVELHRWTDGLKWSPSRGVGFFMIYRQVNGPGQVKRLSPNQRNSVASPFYTLSPHRLHYDPNNIELSLYGSLIDGFDFVEGGLVKKTFVGICGGRRFRIISYYTAADVLSGKLLAPLDHPVLNYYTFDDDEEFRVTIPGASDSATAGAPNVDTVRLTWPQSDPGPH